ncbi:allantoate amidohydrolase [Halomonas sp. MCCC 1A11036]|uniref:Allantoate amidohydrolase n=1 Tax=Billgrantia zhangzhouensis TaxID=2733481 RepID=A0ABS9AAJ1_9GAMM|nr:allantoate amidohydrolase [Halomonas zhangzhouensis]MCE8018582.1 allantoate amidohydrolase [Halomonas zhangzhouensis]
MTLSLDQAGRQAWQWLEAAAEFSETRDVDHEGVTRRCATGEHRRVLEALTEWMEALGMSVRLDNAANLIGRHASHSPDARTLLIGSHQDTVPHGGKYDGMMGVILPLALVMYLRGNDISLPFHIDVVAFSDEEGTRFSSTLLGSKVLAGTFEPEMLKTTDDQGVTLHAALEAFGCDPTRIPLDRYSPEEVVAFLEVHIEQGPQLEHASLPVGVVSAITGIERHQVKIHGMAGHAGTVPMSLRRDALVGAAEVIRLVDVLCKETKDLVGVVGKIENAPNGVNVIPQTTTLSIELRSPHDEVRQRARKYLIEQIGVALETLDLAFGHTLTYEQSAVQCSSWLTATLEEAVQDCGIEPLVLFSGAGHDGLAMADLCDIGMLFVRCREGVSHHPSEAIEPEDLTAAVEVLVHTCQRLARRQPLA